MSNHGVAATIGPALLVVPSLQRFGGRRVAAQIDHERPTERSQDDNDQYDRKYQRLIRQMHRIPDEQRDSDHHHARHRQLTQKPMP
jgi:hypothetical protein